MTSRCFWRNFLHHQRDTSLLYWRWRERKVSSCANFRSNKERVQKGASRERLWRELRLYKAMLQHRSSCARRKIGRQSRAAPAPLKTPRLCCDSQQRYDKGVRCAVYTYGACSMYMHFMPSIALEQAFCRNGYQASTFITLCLTGFASSRVPA